MEESLGQGVPIRLEYGQRLGFWRRVWWLGVARIGACCAAMGSAGAVIIVGRDFLFDPRGWYTNDALIWFLCWGTSGAVVSVAALLCDYVVRRKVARRWVGLVVLSDVIVLLLGGWFAYFIAHRFR